MKHIYFLLLTVQFFLISFSSIGQNFPGGVPGEEVWYKITPQDLQNGDYLDYSENKVEIEACNEHDKALFNFNPCIKSDKICIQYKTPLEREHVNNLFIVSEPKDIQHSFRHITTNYDEYVRQTLYPGEQILNRNTYVIETQQGFASKMQTTFNSTNRPAHVYFYDWNNYDIDRKYKSFGEVGETTSTIGAYSDFQPLEDGLDFNGLLPEYILYNRKLTDNERNRVESYLGLKFGITLDRERDYKNSKNKIFWDKKNNRYFPVNIFGIGRDDISGLNQLQCESAHARDYLVAAVNHIEETNEEVQQGSSIENNNFLVFGNTKDTGLSEPNELNLRLLKKVWLAQVTGDMIEKVPIHFRLSLDNEFAPYIPQIKHEELVVWMLHDKYVDNTSVSEFNNGNIEYYKAADLEFDTNGKSYAHFRDYQELPEGIHFDQDHSFYDQYTFAVGPEIIVQVRYVQWQCKEKCFKIEIVVQGGKPDYDIGLTDESGNLVDVNFDRIEDNKYIYTAAVCATRTYIVKVIDANGATVDYDFLVEEQHNTLDLGPDQDITSQQTEFLLNAGQGIESPDNATYQWYYNGEQFNHPQSTLLVDQPGEYCVTVTTGDMICQLDDCITIGNKLKGIIKPVSACDEEYGEIEVTIDDGVPPFAIHIEGNGVNLNLSQSNSSFSVPNLSAGTYEVTITDNIGSSFTDTIVLSGNVIDMGSLGPDQTLTAIQQEVVLDGTLPFGDNPDYSYQWYRDGELLSETSSQLTVSIPGEYKVLIQRPDDCDAEASIIIDHEFKGSIDYAIGCDSSSNSIQVMIDYGIPDYITTVSGIQLNGDPYNYEYPPHSGNISFSGIPFGNYIVTVADQYGSSFEQEIEFEGIELNIHEQLENLVENQCGSGGMYVEDSCGEGIPLAIPSDSGCSTFTLDASSLIDAGQNVSYQWFIFGVPIGDGSPELTFESSGDCYAQSGDTYYDPEYSCDGLPLYTVTVTENTTGCSVSQSFTSRLWCPVIEDHSRPSSTQPELLTKIYPNPSGQAATFYYDVSSEENFDGVVELYDMNGRIIKHINISGQSSYTLPFSMLSAGVYFITTTTNGKLTTDRIIIE